MLWFVDIIPQRCPPAPTPPGSNSALHDKRGGEELDQGAGGPPMVREAAMHWTPSAPSNMQSAPCNVLLVTVRLWSKVRVEAFLSPAANGC